jgi:serine protease Do
MKKYVLVSSLFLCSVLLASRAQSQDEQSGQQREEIIIRKKGDFPKNLTIQLNGDQVTINGKKPEDVKGNIEVIRRKSSGNEGETYGYGQSPQPFGGNHGFSFSSPMTPFSADRNKALLGVLTVPTDSSDGAKVEEVERGTPADSAGLQKGDIIVKINDTAIHSTGDLSDAIGQYSPGDQVTVSYNRKGRMYQADVKLGRNDNGGASYGLRQFNFQGPQGRPDMQNFMQQFRRFHPYLNPGMNNRMMTEGPHLGITVEGRDDQDGVTVQKVQQGSVAAQSGFKPGDILSSLAGEKISSVDDVLNAWHEHLDDKRIQATVVRDGRQKTLTVEIPKPHQQADL